MLSAKNVHVLFLHLSKAACRFNFHARLASSFRFFVSHSECARKQLQASEAARKELQGCHDEAKRLAAELQDKEVRREIKKQYLTVVEDVALSLGVYTE